MHTEEHVPDAKPRIRRATRVAYMALSTDDDEELMEESPPGGDTLFTFGQHKGNSYWNIVRKSPLLLRLGQETECSIHRLCLTGTSDGVMSTTYSPTSMTLTAALPLPEEATMQQQLQHHHPEPPHAEPELLSLAA